MQTPGGLPSKLSPFGLFLAVLAIVASAEAGIMLVLPYLIDESATPAWKTAAIDTTALVLICTPLFWHLFLRPLRAAVESESVQARTIMDTAADGIIALDTQGMVRGFNRAAESIFGYAATDILGHPVAMLMPTAEGTEDAQWYLHSPPGTVVSDRRELRGRRHDGTDFPLELAVSERKINGKRAFTAIVRDLTAQKEFEIALLRTHTLLETIFSNMQGLIAYLDTDFRFIRVNPAYAEADGKTVDFFPGKHHFDIYPSEENEIIFRRVARTGEPYVAYARPFAYPDHPERGTSYWDWTLQPIKNHSGKVESLLLTLSNVTKQVRAQKALREQEQNERALLNAAAESAFLLQDDGTILMANEVGVARFGQTLAIMLGANIYSFMPPKVALSRRAHINRSIETGMPEVFEDSLGGRHFRVAIHPVRDEDGQIRRIAFFATDITEQRMLRGLDALLHEVDRSLLAGATLPEVLAQICDQTTTLLDLRLAWVGKKLPDGTVGVCASGGPAKAYINDMTRIGVRWDDTPMGRGPAGSAIRSCTAHLMKPNASAFEPWREAAERYDIRANQAFPLLLRGEVYGVLSVYADRENLLHDPQVRRALKTIVDRLDVTLERWLDQQQLQLLSTALAAAGNSILITDREGRIQWVNAAFSRLTGYSAEEAVGQTPRLFKSGKQDAAYYKTLWNTILAGDVWSHETEERHKDGSFYTVQQTITPIQDEMNQITHFISIQEDISAQKAAEQRIQHMAHHDALTDLPNRTLFLDRLRQALNVAKRDDDHIALLFLDLDRFKPVNDTYGHAVGDRLLQEVAHRLTSCVRESDTVARFAGDEFTVILAGVSVRESAATVAEKIIKSLSTPFQIGELSVQIGTSIGIAFYPEDARDPDDLIRLADQAMYRAKHQSRNTYRFHALS